MSNFVPFAQFDQDDKFPHKSSRKILNDVANECCGIESVVAGIGVTIDNTDPKNPVVSVVPPSPPILYPELIPPQWTVLKILPDPDNNYEVGQPLETTVHHVFYRGDIKGKIENGAWLPNESQDSRSGAITGMTVNSVPVTGAFTQMGYSPVSDTPTDYEVAVTYNEGRQPVASNGADYDVPYPAGTDVQVLTRKAGRRQIFGDNLGIANVVPTTSAEIRSMGSPTGGFEWADFDNGNTFNFTVALNANRAVFAYPKSMPLPVIMQGSFDVTPAFTETEVMVEGHSGYTPIPYRVFTFIPVEPYPSSVTYSVTIGAV